MNLGVISEAKARKLDSKFVRAALNREYDIIYTLQHQKLKVGNQVLIFDMGFGNKPNQFKIAKITSIKPIFDGEFAIRVQDGKYSFRISDFMVKLDVKEPTKWKVGSRIKARYTASDPKFYPGRIAKLTKSGKAFIHFNDGDKYYVPIDWIKKGK